MNRVNRMLFSSVLIFLSAFLSSCSLYQKSQLSETDRFNQWADKVFDERVERYPTSMTYLGIKKDYGKLDDWSDQMEQKELDYSKKQLKELRTFEYDKLNEVTKVSYKLMEDSLENDIHDFKFRFHGYPVSQMFGAHTHLSSFMINMHQVGSEQDARDYISRLREFSRVFDQLIVNLKEREKRGVILPAFLIPKVIEQTKSLQQGQPIGSEKKDHVLLADFKAKVNKLDISKEKKSELISQAKTALKEHVGPSYKKLAAFMESQQDKATDQAGAWKLPNGGEYYMLRLKRSTTTDLTPEQVHQLGLKEVERIHGEIKKIMKEVGFKGSLQAFFKHMKSQSKFFYPSTEKGRQAYFKRTQEVIDEVKRQLPKMISIPLKDELIVKRVEPFREKNVSRAFYQSPAPDGSRPGIYYVNLYDMSDMAKYDLQALAYHEAIPGHHLQLSIAGQLKDLPKFRRHGGYTAYTEGWGLYAEWLAHQMGLYRDPYAQFGRLSMELWRAVRLVTDTGLHAKKWTRDQAVDYFGKNTPQSRDESIREVERYIVMPGQATSYKVGMLKLMELREKAKEALGDKYEATGFHDEVLRHGAVPLTVLEQLIDRWIERTLAQSQERQATKEAA